MVGMPYCTEGFVKPKLLVTELWGLGDLVIATPFLQAVSKHFRITLLAKPYALDLQPRFWPEVEVRPFVAPWTAFYGKYFLWRWPWGQIFKLRTLRRKGFEVGLSARWDPRDHVLLWVAGARRRMGYPRLNSHIFLNSPLARPDPIAHRYEHWRALAIALGLDLPAQERPYPPANRRSGPVVVHSGAGQPVRVWPLDGYRRLVEHLRNRGYKVVVACDTDQKEWWTRVGESELHVPHSVSELMALLDAGVAFIGNDSGPSHLAAACGLPTLTLFGPQLPEWFAPLGKASEFVEGKPCPYKPCSDYCRFPLPFCISRITHEEVWGRVQPFLQTRGIAPG
jgi:ADP-heptose:LPS heptosyltransferase